jgi:hypothetical protein
MRGWRFDAAEALMADARTVIAQRTALEAQAARDGIALPDDVQRSFQAGAFADASARAEAERRTIVALETAAGARASPDDLLSTIGSLGANPDADLAEARAAVTAGDLDGAAAAAARADSAYTGAWDEGRRRLLLAVAVIATLLVLGSAVIGTLRRGRRRRRRMMAHRDLRADAS